MNKSFIILLVSILLGCTSSSQMPVDFQGEWHGYLDLGEDQLPFWINLEKSGNDWTAYLINDEEKLAVPEVTVKGDSLHIVMNAFDSEVFAKMDKDGIIRGRYQRNYQENYHSGFVAEKNIETRFPVLEGPSTDFSGKWEFEFTRSDSSTYQAIGIFDQHGNKLTGTFLTNFGDYRYLEGNVSGDTFFLSAFDGGHAFLFTGSESASGNVSGRFRSGPIYFQTFRAFRNADFELPENNELTQLKDGFETLDFSFPDINGKVISLSDSIFQDKIVLVQLFGTWCANCMDETNFLASWYEENKDKGIEIVALAFESKPEFEYAVGRLKKHAERFDVPYPQLIAGVSNKEKAALSLPALKEVLAFPTLIYMDKNHKVRKIHTGFNGPGTGDYYAKWVEEHKLFIDKLLSE
ncbi:TlpA family protein disulfide reductase [Algoriphagus aestuarii]|nr:TlpA family protein disulfide reductase [Algoriphagus aestuarii]